MKPTRYIPLDGIVKKTSDQITRGGGTDLDRARAIYDWVVENTFRDPKVRGCGTGDIRFMLESNHLGGKCADLNALYVGLVRAAGIPARNVYGLRVASSGAFKSLGLGSDSATSAQHCRAEVYLTGFGWVPIDPGRRPEGGARGVAGQSADERPARGPRAYAAVRLVGNELDWYNEAHDVRLPGSTRGALPYFMYPQAETEQGRVDPIDADNFRYTITVGAVD